MNYKNFPYELRPQNQNHWKVLKDLKSYEQWIFPAYGGRWMFFESPFVVFMAKISSHIVRSVRLPEKKVGCSSSSGGSRPYRAVAREAERQQ